MKLEKEIKNFTNEIQEIANSKNLTFDAKTLLIISLNQYEEYHNKKTDYQTLRKKADYACDCLNDMLEIMIKHFGGRKIKYGR